MRLRLGLGVRGSRQKYAPGPIFQNLSLPVLSGTEIETWTLSTTDGVWSETPDTVTYQWQRDNVNISGATANTYELEEADVGAVITCEVTATKGSTPILVETAGTAAITGVNPPTPGQDGGDQTGDNVSTDNFTFASDTTTGNDIVVGVSIKANDDEVVSMVDNFGNVYERIGLASDSTIGAFPRAELWHANDIVGGASHQITVTFNNLAEFAWGAVELSGVKKFGHDAGALVEQFNTGDANSPYGITSNALKSRKQTMVAWLAWDGGGNDAGIVTPTGYTQFLVYNDRDGIMAGHGAHDTLGNDKTAQTATWTANGSPTDAAAIITSFRAAAAVENALARATQIYAEVVRSGGGGTRATQVYSEVVRSSGDIRATQVYAEVIRNI